MKYAIQYDVFGEHKVKVLEDGKIEVIPDPVLTPERIDAECDAVMGSIWSICKDISNRGRAVPPTKTELEHFFQPKAFKKLCKKGLIKEQLIALRDKKGVNPGSRNCVLLTELGRVYCKTYFEAAHDSI